MRVLAPCLAIATLAACSGWHAVEVTPAEYLRDNHPDIVRVIGSDNSRINLRSPELRGDTIIGLSGTGLPHSTARQMKVPLSGVRGLAVQQFSVIKSIGLYFLITIPVGIAACTGGGIAC